ncbi:response regulator transcription factor [Kitasatospora sp. NPDC049285]|uniref:response regulator transcription factor n=1 Tax=Kitasatospora sp. NPDC049285 TaxID=3157096 RepID=UPI00343E98A0
MLVVENDATAAEGLVHELRRHGHTASSVATGRLALRSHHGADLILLDLDLPDLDGLEVCRRLRAEGSTPIIIVTARGTELDRVLGLQAGSDDYVVKPYGLRELLARIEAVMRRAHPSARPTAPVITHGALRIDTRSREIAMGGRVIPATPKEFDLLHLLASQPGETFSRRQLLRQVWDDEWSRGRTIDTHVSSLRSKLGASGWIVTVRGVGFRLGTPR